MSPKKLYLFSGREVDSSELLSLTGINPDSCLEVLSFLGINEIKLEEEKRDLLTVCTRENLGYSEPDPLEEGGYIKRVVYRELGLEESKVNSSSEIKLFSSRKADSIMDSVHPYLLSTEQKGKLESLSLLLNSTLRKIDSSESESELYEIITGFEKDASVYP